MRGALFSLALLVVLNPVRLAPATAAGTARFGGSAKRHEPPPPPYESDCRFDKPVRLEKSTYMLSDLLEALSRQVGATIRVEGRFIRRRVAASLDGRPGREVMDALALIYPARWEKVDDTYVLVTDRRLAPLVALSDEERNQRAGRAFDRLFDSLNRRQWAVLNATGELPLNPRTTTPGQQRILEELGRMTYASPYVRAAPQTLRGGGFTLRLSSYLGTPELRLWVALESGGQNNPMSKPFIPRSR